MDILRTDDTLSAVLDGLRTAGLSVSVEDGGLKVTGPKSAMTPALAKQIQEHKAELMIYLSPHGAVQAEARPSFLREIDEAAIAKAYETKATLPGGKPPLQEVRELQEWLNAIDWRKGLRCGRSGQQCLTCKGIPCRGSTEWRD
ncbi:MAG TPA: hypothetical protein VJ183_02510 [Chloroflexia bacterium]|nr:hypothetical protein [Chloroflexia bacterium]